MDEYRFHPTDPELLFRVQRWFHSHPDVFLFLLILCLGVSVKLGAGLWRNHTEASVLKRLVWSVVILVPVLGWICYGGLFSVPERTGEFIRPGRR